LQRGSPRSLSHQWWRVYLLANAMRLKLTKSRTSPETSAPHESSISPAFVTKQKTINLSQQWIAPSAEKDFLKTLDKYSNKNGNFQGTFYRF